jgi:moderate conductance mechanosensitive channel
MIGTVLAAIAVMAAVVLMLSYVGVADVRVEGKLAVDWLLTRGVKIVIIVLAAGLVKRAARIAIHTAQRQLASREEGDLEWQRRASTLGGTLTRVVTVLVWFVAVMMLLRELAIDVLPILTGAGIAGLAIGFGAQNLVRDVISGFFLILEDQIRVGDVARINGIGGAIEEVNLRTIVLRDVEGAVHVFPNGTVTSLANLSKQFAYAIVDLRVGYAENFDRVFGTIREVGAAMQHEPFWEPLLLEPVDISGIESIGDGFAVVRARFKTQPLNQGRVANELRRRLLGAFVGRGIRPYAG